MLFVTPDLRPRNSSSQPLAIAIRASPEVRGFRRGVAEENVALYADDLLLFLGDTQSSLLKVMQIIKNFGQFSGLTRNWEKSVLLPVEPLKSPLPDEIAKIEIVDKMKYLGINITSDSKQ